MHNKVYNLKNSLTEDEKILKQIMKRLESQQTEKENLNRTEYSYEYYIYQLLVYYSALFIMENIADRQEAVIEVADALGNITRTETDAQLMGFLIHSVE